MHPSCEWPARPCKQQKYTPRELTAFTDQSDDVLGLADRQRHHRPAVNDSPGKNPIATEDAAGFIIGRDLPLIYEIASVEMEKGLAREANGTWGVPLCVAVQATYIGVDAQDLPAFLFTHQVIDANLPITPHDHWDNFSGGYSFSVYYPGTGIPQQPWRQ